MLICHTFESNDSLRPNLYHFYAFGRVLYLIVYENLYGYFSTVYRYDPIGCVKNLGATRLILAYY